MSKVKYTWDADTGFSMCTILYNDTKYVGTAQCHPEDVDFQSQLVGSELAYLRATISLMQGIKKEKRSELKALKSLYGSLTPSPRFNPDSFETKMLIKRIAMTNEDIDILKECIQDLRQIISDKIDASEKFYQSVRKNRKQRENAKEE